jgi:hypothetical protein
MIRKDRKEHQNKDGTMNKKVKRRNSKRRKENDRKRKEYEGKEVKGRLKRKNEAIRRKPGT